MASLRNMRMKLAVCACSAVFIGCEADFSGFEDLLDGSPTYANLPGRRIAAGRFRRPIVDGTDTSGPYVVGFDLDDGPRLAIIPFDGGQGCRTGKGNLFQTSAYPPSSKLDLVFPYVEPESGDQPQRLHFTDSSCRDVVEPITSSGLPLSAAWLFEDPEGYLTFARDGRLIFVEAWNEKQRLIATDVTKVLLTQHRIWTLEAGSFVVRDYKFEEVARFGAAVTELTVTTLSALHAAYVEGGNLYIVGQELREPTLVDTDVCNVRFPDSWGGFGMSYHSPCADRRLVLREILRRTSNGLEEVDNRHDLASGTSNKAPEVRADGDETHVFYLTTEPGVDIGTLWGGSLGKTFERIGDNARLDGITTPAAGEWRVLVDRRTGPTDSSDDEIGRLVQWKPGSVPRDIAQNVIARHQGPAALVNFDGVTGDAVVLDGSGRAHPLAKGVPRNGMINHAVGRALISDFDGTTGTLLVGPFDAFDYEVVRDGVSPNELRFVENLEAIGYLYDYDSATNTGTLAVRVIETADTFDAGVIAREWREIYWPEPGLMYVVPQGDKQGIWFAGLL